MPRQPRYFVPDLPQHVITRGVDRQAVFFRPEDYALYKRALQETADASECQIHAYVLMTNHVHLLVTPLKERSLPLMMQAMGRNYVQRLNPRYNRSGTLWEGRYKASLVQDDRYFLACQRYIELNPVRAAMVDAPGQYLYSSFTFNAAGQHDPLLTPHPVYLALHKNPQRRQQAYRSLCNDVLTDDELSQIRKCTNAGAVIGNERFRKQIELMLGRSVPTGKMGRPRKIEAKSG
jgi:putative transposase